ncbi:Lipoma-preferred partner [Liparis tanakae]|uniref:Lipoma-preferred partner n=1 Tax=Liparis tanakae TaxID=230148 RepID=A0A4Z2I8R0_9TELE|nr:Lipoma-preferred partner [Liparis tanakae]
MTGSGRGRLTERFGVDWELFRGGQSRPADAWNTSVANLCDLTSFPSKELESAQNSVSLAASSPSAPVTGYKRMVIPTQPPLTATKKSTPKPQAPGGVSSIPPSPASTMTRAQSHSGPQPVPASYATASTPSQPTFNVQVRSAQPGPQHQAPIGHHFGQQPIRSPAQVQYMPAQPKGPDFAYGPPQPGFSQMAPVGYQEQFHPGVPQVGGLSLRRPEPAPVQAYQPSGPRKTYITDVPPGLVPYHAGPAIPPKHSCRIACGSPLYTSSGRGGAKVASDPRAQLLSLSPERILARWKDVHVDPKGFRYRPPETRGRAEGKDGKAGGAHTAHPEDELERLTKKMLFDMDNPPSEEYFDTAEYLAVWEAVLKVESKRYQCDQRIRLDSCSGYNENER